MRLPALIHLVESAQALSHSDRILVFGSSALLASFPALGEPGQPLELSYDADLLLDPCDEHLAAVLHEAIGDGSLFAQRSGYHADILRANVIDQLAPGWETRLIHLQGVASSAALSPADLAAVKLRAGRSKDIELCRHLFQHGLLDPAKVKALLDATPLPENEIIEVYQRFREATQPVR